MASNDPTSIFSECNSAIRHIMNTITDRTITLSDFRHLAQYAEEVGKIYQEIDELEDVKDELQKAFVQRRVEYDLYATFAKDLSEFWPICKASFEGNQILFLKPIYLYLNLIMY